MSFFKIGSAEILSSFGSNSRIANPSLDSGIKYNDYKTSDGFLYVRVRAISSRVNRNWDGWPSDELAESYQTFVGKPIFIDHNNSNPGRTRGVVVDAALHVDDGNKTSKDSYYASAPDNHKPPTWVELLLEVDAKSFPRLAKAIINKDIDGVSMGANVEYTKCSHCGNRAEDPTQFCSHILNKGALFDYKQKDGRKTSKNSYEDCYKVSFFEISFVFDPADETALVRDIRHAHTASVRAAVENEGNHRHVFSEAFGDQTSDMWLSGIAREAWNDGYNNNVNSPDPRSAAWQAAVDAVSGAGFPEEAVQVANKLAQTFDVAAGTPEEMQGADMPYDTEVDATPMHPTLREMALQRPNNSANPVMSKTAAPGMTPQIDLTSIPQDVDTLRAEKPCPLCFAPGTLVRVREGYVPIETIEVGDEVLTHTGKFEKVLQTLERDYNGLMVELKAQPFIEPIFTTPEHPFKTLYSNHPSSQKKAPCAPGTCEKNQGFLDQHRLDWSCAEHLTTDSYLVATSPSEYIDRAEISIPDQFRGFIQKNGQYSRRGPTNITLTDEFLWVAGLYIAEGSAHNRELQFSLHAHETTYMDRIRTVFEGLGFTTRTTHKGNGKGAWVFVHSSMLAEWFASWFGEGCDNKAIPEDLLNLPNHKLTKVIEGIFAGDGRKAIGNVHQTSPMLALQLVEYGLRTGNTPSITAEHTEGKRRTYTTHRFGMVGTQITPQVKYGRGKWQFDGHKLYRVSKAGRIPYWGPVYNLEVEDSNTYVVQNILVHNCGNTTEAGQCPTCGWESEPEGLDNPDLTKAKPNLPPPTDTQPIQSDQPPPGQPPMNGVPSGGLPPNGTGQGGSMGGVSAHFGVVYSNESHFGTVYIDSAINLISEKTAAQPNLDGGRINTQEKPLLPISRQVSDRPKNQKTISDSPKPVESKTKQGN